MSNDLRNFTYALEALRCKHQWQLEAAQACLARSLREQAAAATRLSKLRQEHADCAAKIASNALRQLDPAMHRGALAYLQQLAAQICQCDEALQAMDRQCERLRQACLVENRKTESFARDRERCMSEAGQAARTLAGHEADYDWNARRAWRAAQA